MQPYIQLDMSNSKAQKMVMLCLGIVISVLISWFPISEGCWAGDDCSSSSQFRLNIHKVSHYTFFSRNYAWPTPSKYNLTYSFPQGFMPNGMPAVALAFQEWASKTPFRFTQVANDAVSDIKISFQRGSHAGDGYSFDGKGETVAHAFAPQSGLFHFDEDDSFSIGAVPASFDVQTVSVHETGHLLGLDHSTEPNAIMYKYIDPGTTKTTLHADDINGIKDLYNLSSYNANIK